MNNEGAPAARRQVPDEIRTHAREVAAQAPPPTPEQVEALRRIFPQRPADPLARARDLPGVIGPLDLTDAQLDAQFDALLAKLADDLDVEHRLPDGRRRA